MKKRFKQNAGLTLIELVVAIAMATIVTAAATSVLLMGLRINRQTGDTASQQITVRSLLNVMEDAAVGGNITKVESDFVDAETQETQYGSWLVKGKDGQTVIFQYNAKEQTIYTNGVAVLEGVIASNAIMEGQLLSVSVETKTGIYTSSVYCRTADSVDEQGAPSIGENDGTGRGKFIEILKSQYRSRGEIKYTDSNPKEEGDYTYYSEWYIGGYQTDSRWNSKTPWCACYISWALVKAGKNGPEGHEKWFANVDDFMEYFTPKDATATATTMWLPGGSKPTAGDLIFFDWDRGTDPEHVGVVLSVDTTKNIVFTIEGNSAGRVTVRTYPLTDPRIIGYGVLFAS